MPTRRSLVFFGIALLLYVFANQTQVGWIYLMAAISAALPPVGWLLNRGMLRGLSLHRNLGEPGAGLYEGDPLRISLHISNERRGPAAQIQIRDVCPLAEPGEAREIEVFISSLRGRGRLQYDYDIRLHRRGLHLFEAARADSGAPFGFARSGRRLDPGTRALVYPELRPLRRLELLDRQPTPEALRLAAGAGSEVLGVRPYRVGDSPRHIHWRSVARSGQLISKEFAEERQPGLTLALDLFAHPYPDPDDKQNPFEWAVKAAASVGDYALRRGYPLHLLADNRLMALPRGPMTLHSLLEYLARVQPAGQMRLSELIEGRALQSFVLALLPWPDPEALVSLARVQAQGLQTAAVCIDPATFPAGGPAGLAAGREGGPAIYSLGFGEDWAVILAGEGQETRP